MSSSIPDQIVRQLCGWTPSRLEDQPDCSWNRVLIEVIQTLVPAARQAEVSDDLLATWLTDPVEVAEAPDDGLQDVLRNIKPANRAARLIQSLARWWVELDRQDAGAELADRDLETLSQQLQSYPGISREWAERILCHVAGRPIMPLSRAALRIVCRHGWLDLQTEYDDWQAWFARGLDDSTASFIEVSRALEVAGHNWCGPRPQCEECPLAPLLPPQGPCLGDD